MHLHCHIEVLRNSNWYIIKYRFMYRAVKTQPSPTTLFTVRVIGNGTTGSWG